jgi:hypothetical protein
MAECMLVESWLTVEVKVANSINGVAISFAVYGWNRNGVLFYHFYRYFVFTETRNDLQL